MLASQPNVPATHLQALTLYLLSIVACQFYAKKAAHFTDMWTANMSNILLSWTFIRAIVRATYNAITGKQSQFTTHTESAEKPDLRMEPRPPPAEPPANSESGGPTPIRDITRQIKGPTVTN